MLTLKSPGVGRWLMKQKTGSEFFRRTRRWHQRVLVLDGRNDRYFERIEDSETGELVEHKDERLSEHTGRGSARSRRIKRAG